MALIPCPECKRLISDQVFNCQFCGAAIQSQASEADAPAEKREVSPALAIVAVLIVAGIGYAVVNGMRGSDASEEAATPPAAPATATAPNARVRDPRDPMAEFPLMEIEDSSILPPGAPPMRVMPTPNWERNDRMRMEGIRAQIRQAIIAQEIHFAERQQYAKSVLEFSEFNDIPVIRLKIITGDSWGYGIVGTHDSLPGSACAIFIGDMDPVAPATKKGQIECKEAK